MYTGVASLYIFLNESWFLVEWYSPATSSMLLSGIDVCCEAY
jgi:hypothetical protein